MLSIVDTETGNLQSVANAFRRVGLETIVVETAAKLERAQAIALPGVGAFEQGMSALRDKGLIEPLLRRANGDGVPLLGICLGMQLLADSSEELGNFAGLGLIPGRVIRLEMTRKGFRVPNFGWHVVTPCRAGVLFSAGAGPESFYFAHSYHFRCDRPEDAAATIDFSDRPITVALEHGNVFGVQFHPEKSQDAGLDVLERFARYVREKGPADR
ncbi:MAG: imidazole glycerol phosphate synthase subunit HisH [Rhodospirillales bacterium]